MKWMRFTLGQFIRVLKEAENRLQVSELCRQQGISEATYYQWKSKYGGLEVSEAKRLRALEEENRRLKQLVADKELGIWGLRADQEWLVYPKGYLTPLQVERMAYQPDMILATAHLIRDDFIERGHEEMEVRADAYV